MQKLTALPLFPALLLVLCLPLDAAKPTRYEVIGSGVDTENPASFALPYTLGTHLGTVSKVTGSLMLDLENLLFMEGKFEADIGDIQMDGDKLSCHMREALGLNYSVSDFPDDHVCDDNALPAEGKNAIAYSKILFNLESGKPTGPPSRQDKGATPVELQGRWNIHGVEQPENIKMTLTVLNTGNLLLQGKHTFSLKRYGVIVKPFLFVKTKDLAEMEFQLLLRSTR